MNPATLGWPDAIVLIVLIITIAACVIAFIVGMFK